MCTYPTLLEFLTSRCYYTHHKSEQHIVIHQMDPQGNAASSSKGEGICVGIRMRPLNDREIQSGQEKIFKCVPNCNAITHTNTADTGPGQIYYYDKVCIICAMLTALVNRSFNCDSLGLRRMQQQCGHILSHCRRHSPRNNEWNKWNNLCLYVIC